MTTYKLGLPSELRRRLEYTLPRQRGYSDAAVQITPRDRNERRCAVYAADHYEVNAFYTSSEPGSLDALEAALAAVPGVYLTTRVLPSAPFVNMFTNPAWPAALGTARRDRNSLRTQVIALMRDEAL